MYISSRDDYAMSKSQLHAFIDRARSDEQFRSRLSSMNPKQIIEFAAESGFQFSDEIKGRFINRWKGVYFCPQAIEVGILCPGLVPPGYKIFFTILNLRAVLQTLRKKSMISEPAVFISQNNWMGL